MNISSFWPFKRWSGRPQEDFDHKEINKTIKRSESVLSSVWKNSISSSPNLPVKDELALCERTINPLQDEKHQKLLAIYSQFKRCEGEFFEESQYSPSTKSKEDILAILFEAIKTNDLDILDKKSYIVTTENSDNTTFNPDSVCIYQLDSLVGVKKIPSYLPESSAKTEEVPLNCKQHETEEQLALQLQDNEWQIQEYLKLEGEWLELERIIQEKAERGYYISLDLKKAEFEQQEKARQERPVQEKKSLQELRRAEQEGEKRIELEQKTAQRIKEINEKLSKVPQPSTDLSRFLKSKSKNPGILYPKPIVPTKEDMEESEARRPEEEIEEQAQISAAKKRLARPKDTSFQPALLDKNRRVVSNVDVWRQIDMSLTSDGDDEVDVIRRKAESALREAEERLQKEERRNRRDGVDKRPQKYGDSQHRKHYFP